MDWENKSDGEVLASAASQPSAFAVLVDRYQTPFLRRACQILHDVDEAEDAVQDAFVRIYRSAPQFTRREGAQFSSWAYKILTNACLTRYRQLQKRRARFAPLLGDEALASGVVAGYAEAETNSLLSALPHILRRVMTLRYLGGWSYQQLAELEQVTPATIRSRIHRAKKFLTKKFNV